MNVTNTVGDGKNYDIDSEVLAGVGMATAAGIPVITLCGRDCTLSWHSEHHAKNPRSRGKLPTAPGGTRGPSARSLDEFLTLAARYPGTTGYGLLCGGEVMLLDLDYEADVEAVRQLIKERRLPAPTAWVRTPRGWRLCYRPDSSGCGYTLDAHGARVKVLGRGQFGVGPGCIGWDGTRYTACGAWDDIERWPVLPDELRPASIPGGQGFVGFAWPGSDAGHDDQEDPLGALPEVQELRQRFTLPRRLERWRRVLDGALRRGNISRGENSGAGAGALSLLRRGVFRLLVEPRVAAEQMARHPWNAAAVDEHGEPWPWAVDGQDGLLRLALKAARPRGCPAGWSPGDWLKQTTPGPLGSSGADAVEGAVRP